MCILISLKHSFSNCGACTTTGMPVIGHRYVACCQSVFPISAFLFKYRKKICATLELSYLIFWYNGKKWESLVWESSYTGCNRRNGPDFGRVFLMLNYTAITQNTYIQSWTVTEIMTIEMCGLLGCRRTVRRPWRHTCLMRTRTRDMVIQSAQVSSDVTR